MPNVLRKYGHHQDPDSNYPALPSKRILIVDDDRDFRELAAKCLATKGLIVSACDSLTTMVPLVKQFSFDVILLDVRLGHENGLDALSFLPREAPYSRVLVTSASNRIELAVDAMRRGAAGFVSKLSGIVAICDAVNTLITNSSSFEAASEEVCEYGLVGVSPAMQRVRSDISRFRNVDCTVLICGESGTGKELVARALHHSSKRNTGAFHALNCSAIPEALLESELFGHKKGAFTDAREDRRGLFEICSNGTLLLDEIGEMPLGLQAKMLRVLQEREVRPVGSSITIPVGTRVVAATNRDLNEEVLAKRFRQDMFFRLAILKISLPSLRERPEDVPVLLRHFLAMFSKKYQRSLVLPDNELMIRLQCHDWPGNVRELRNAIERAVVLSCDGKLHLEDLFWDQKESPGLQKSDHLSAFMHQDGDMTSMEAARDSFDRYYLQTVLKTCRGNITDAARICGQHRQNLYRLLEKHRIDVSLFREG